jgi:hypothetical protein
MLDHRLLQESVTRGGALPEAPEERAHLLDVEGRYEDDAGTPSGCRFMRFGRLAANVVCDHALMLRPSRRRVVLVALAAIIAAVAACVAAPAPSQSRRVQFPVALACGVERWTVKTLADRPRLFPLRNTTIAYLVSRPPPRSLPRTRLPFERHIFRVTAAVILVRPEADSDLHLVIKNGARHMIAEAPSPSCTTRATPIRRRQMTQARNAVRLCSNAVVTGVAFFDFKHGQTGVAPNAIELHPILGFRCLLPPPPPPPPPPPTTPPPPPPPPGSWAA